MNNKTPGRNDPCPCGSGRKYKHCCLNKTDEAKPGAGPAESFSAELKAAIAGRSFASMDEVQNFMSGLAEQRNRAPLDDFHGLSPDQMYHVLYHPFDSPQVLRFTERLDDLPVAPILTLFNLLAQAMSEKGIKPTATGNLPRNLCREIAQTYYGDEAYRERTRDFGINTELDFMDLHITRIVSKLAGLIRNYKGRFILSRAAKTLTAAEGPYGIYLCLLITYTRKFNWAYRDGYPDLPFIQQAFAFTLYLLHRYGTQTRPQDFYEDAFLGAFPALLQEVEDSPYTPAEKQLRDCYTYRALRHFAAFFGLADVVPASDDILNREYQVTTRSLLGKVVQFTPASPAGGLRLVHGK